MRIIVFLSILLIVTNRCNRESGIQKDTQKRILLHKQFIKEISFEGKVTDKIYCNKCDFNKYQIKITSDDIVIDKIEFSNLSFAPYYSIPANNEIILSVNKELYDVIQKEYQIKKTKNSNSLSIKNMDYRLLSQEKYIWIPSSY